MPKANKIYLDEQKKIYQARLELGKQTDTADLDGKVVVEKSIPQLNSETIKEVFTSLLGKQIQTVRTQNVNR